MTMEMNERQNRGDYGEMLCNSQLQSQMTLTPKNSYYGTVKTRTLREKYYL